MVVTTKDGGKYLVHKGKDYGLSSQTVVTYAQWMSNRWSNIGTEESVNGVVSVGDFVKAGGSDYNLFCDNCHHARRRMEELG